MGGHGVPTYNIYLVNRARYSPFMSWTAAKATQVANELQGLYAQVCNGTDYNPIVQVVDRTGPAWQAPNLLAGEVAAHILSNSAASLIQRQMPSAHMESDGASCWLDGAMISEIYISSAPRRPIGVAKLIFHELMHNKLDTHPDPSLKSCEEIHDSGGGGVANARINFQSPLTEENIALMRAALGRHIPQYLL